MLYAVIFEDNTGLGDDVRVAHMVDHLTFLERHADEIMAAGPLRETSGNLVGGLWLVKANARSSVEALIKEDPFWPTGLRAWSEFLHGSKSSRTAGDSFEVALHGSSQICGTS